MLSLATVAARLIQYTGAMVLFGAPLFFLYGLPAEGPGSAARLHLPRRLLLWSAAILLPTAIVAIFIQTAAMAGAWSAALDLESLQIVLTGTHPGWALAGRIGLALGILAALNLIKPSRRLWVVVAVLGAGIVASFAWSGHGAAGDGWRGVIHLISDLLHLFTAALWIGALAALAILFAASWGGDEASRRTVLHHALDRFSGIGAMIVAVLVATGLVNSAFLVGWNHLWELATTPYGLVLSAKLLLFGAMLILAAVNRFVLTPTLENSRNSPSGADAMTALRRSVLVETAAAMAVLALVSILGTLDPITMQ
jgi:putative copper resistance protein D